MGASPLLAVAEIVLTSLAAAEAANGATTRNTSEHVDEIVSLELFDGVAKGNLNLLVKNASGKEILKVAIKENVSFPA